MVLIVLHSSSVKEIFIEHFADKQKLYIFIVENLENIRRAKEKNKNHP